MARRDVVATLVSNFLRSFRRPPPPTPIGEDHLGNKYFEFIPGECEIACFRSSKCIFMICSPLVEAIDIEKERLNEEVSVTRRETDRFRDPCHSMLSHHR